MIARLVLSIAAAIALTTLQYSPSSSLWLLVSAHPSVKNCTEKYFEHDVADHFRFESLIHIRQRYFEYDGYMNKRNDRYPVFFYFGNEDNVELYVNNTGLMWELGEKFGAKLIFAEHRFYGKSFPYKISACEALNLFTTEQTLADYARLIRSIKALHPNSPVIGFGGSYGGMLAYWFRLKYPFLVEGVISGSAPVVAFLGVGHPTFDPSSFAEIVTKDASPSRGSPEGCTDLFYDTMKHAWDVDSKTANGRKKLAKAFHLCKDLSTEDEAKAAIQYITDPWNYFAMGSYPYPSGYMIHGEGLLPAYPIRVACQKLVDSKKNPYEGLFQAAAMFYNASGQHSCLSESFTRGNLMGKRLSTSLLRAVDYSTSLSSSNCKGSWDLQYCKEMVIPFSNSDRDMFYPKQQFNLTETANSCYNTFGVHTKASYVAIEYGGWAGVRKVTNVVFSNGLMDPWSGGGVLNSRQQGLHPSVVTVVMRNGGHHSDLMFSHPQDTEDIKLARFVEEQEIRKWIKGESSSSSPEKEKNFIQQEQY